MKSRLLLGTVAFAAVTAFAPLALHAADATTTTQTTVTTNDNADVSAIPADEDAMKPDDGAAKEGEVTVDETDGAVTPSAAISSDVDSKTVTTTSTVTDTTVTPPPTAAKPVVAPGVKGHKKGDHKDSAKHAATGGDESNTAGDKAAKAITPLKDSSVPAGAKSEVEVHIDNVPHE